MFNEKFLELFNNLVPEYGPAKTVQGEIVRAVNKLVYEYYNNGFCNNVSGAVNYLGYSIVKFPSFSSFNDLEFIKHFSFGEYYSSLSDEDCKELEISLNKLMDMCVTEFYGKESNLENTEDMYDYQEPDRWDDEEDEYEYDDEYAYDDEY